MADRLSSLDVGYVTGDLSLYPEVLDDAQLLYTATNNAETTLKQTLPYNGKVVVVDDASHFPDSGLIRIHEPDGSRYELVAYDSRTSNVFHVLRRGFGGSIQSTWRPGKTLVLSAVMADHHNGLKDAVVNMERNFGLKELPEASSLNGVLKSQEIRFLSPKPLFWAYPRKGIPSLSVRFQNFTTGHIVRYFWDFGDGGTSLEKSPTHEYTQEGVYTVKLNIITSTGAQGVQTKKDYIMVSKDEAIPFFYVENTASPYSVRTAAAMTVAGTPTSPKTFVFVDQSDGDIVQRNWIFGDGTQQVVDDPDVHVVRHTFSEPNPSGYVVTLLIVYGNRRLKRVELPEPLIVL